MEVLSQKNELKIIGEQRGKVECELKRNLIKLFKSERKVIRAYLAKVKRNDLQDFEVVLALVCESADFELIATSASKIFAKIFSIHEYLDILYLDRKTEMHLRKFCCPFYSVMKPSEPDFYLSLGELPEANKKIECFKLSHLDGHHPDGYMLCQIDPVIIGQNYGLGGDDISIVVLASRHAETSIFVHEYDEVYVHVAIMTKPLNEEHLRLEPSQLKSIGWGKLYNKIHKIM